MDIDEVQSPGVLENAENINEEDSPTPTANSPLSSRAASPVPVIDEDSSEPATQSNSEAELTKKRTYEDDDDGSLCPICLDNWTTTGDHRICSLKCGHLFGFKCVTRWLSLQSKKSCPTCKKDVRKNDIRYIYAKRLTAADTSEIDSIKKQLDLVIEERNRALNDVTMYAFGQRRLKEEIAQLKAQLRNLTNPNQHVAKEIVKLYMEKSVEVSKLGGCRVFDLNYEYNLIMASMKSPNNLFFSYGLSKMDPVIFRPLAFIPMHSLQIRDVCFHPHNNWILAASMDKSFKVIDNITNNAIFQCNHQMPLWSCCWDANYSNILYIGTQTGSVIKYDVRQLNIPVDTLCIEGDMSPVVSVASIPAAPGDPLPQGAVVSCKLDSLWLYETYHAGHIRHQLSLDGPFVSMKYQPSTKQLLVSSRPNNRIAHARHIVSTLSRQGENKIDCDVLHTFQGGGMQKLLSKSCFASHKDENIVAAHEESCKRVLLWSVNTGEEVCSVPAHESVLDLKGFQRSKGEVPENYLVSLTERQLAFYRFNNAC